MAASAHPGRVIRFGAFELDPVAGELRKSGIRVKLAEQPLRILIRLLDRPGEIVTREELRELLWGNDTFVDFEHGLNAAANRLREALGDSAATPRFIETVPRRGYRFIAEVQRPAPASPPIDAAGPAREFPETALPSAGRRRKWAWLAASVLLLFGAGGAWWWTQHRGRNLADWEAHPLTADDGLTTMPAISPDGKLVAYASDRATGKDLDIWVQPLARHAEPVRLTRHPADDEWPSFSPDGTWIAFSSARDGAGVYLVPTLGGSERLLARGCAAPRFSPDGQWVACTAGGPVLFPSQVFVVPVGGGPMRQLAPNLGWAVAPVFSPDGRVVLIRGADTANPVEPHRLWLAPLDGGSAIPTEILSTLEQQGVRFGQVREWLENRILFEGGGQLWDVAFDPRSRRVAGEARQLTRGAVTSVDLRAARSGGTTRLVFRAANRWRHLWRLKLDVNRGKALGEMEALDHSGGSQSLPSSSADGRRLVYLQTQPGGASLRLRDLGTGAEQVLLSAVDSYTRPKLSPDGVTVGYHVPRDGIYAMPSAGGAPTKVLGFQRQAQVSGTTPPAQIYGWTPDGRQIVYWHGQPIRFSALEVSTGISRPLIAHPHRVIHGAELSPDQRWLAFHTPFGSRGPLWIAPVRDGQAGEESEWRKVFDRGVENARPWWSPDGTLLYFMSLLDGFPCIYAQRLHPGNKHPVGDPMPVYHFHSARVHPNYRGLAYFGPAILPDGIIFSLVHEMGNVWYAECSE